MASEGKHNISKSFWMWSWLIGGYLILQLIGSTAGSQGKKAIYEIWDFTGHFLKIRVAAKGAGLGLKRYAFNFLNPFSFLTIYLYNLLVNI